jgi:TNF receptor-associated factor 4
MLPIHVATCKFGLTPCPLECRDWNNEIKAFGKKDLERHLKEDCSNRISECRTCSKRGRYSEIRLHSVACDPGKTKVSCPDCDNDVCDDMHEHFRNECVFTAVPCKFKSIGCKKKTRRRDTVAHEQDLELHLGIALNAVLELKEAVVKLQEENVRLKERGSDLIIFSVNEFEARKCTDQKLTSPSFYSSPSGYRMACRVYANGDGDGKNMYVSIRAALLEGRNDNEVKWPFVGSITFTLLNQLEDKNHYSSTTTLKPEHNAVVGIDWGKPKFLLHSRLGYNEAKNTQYLMDDKLFFKVTVEVAGFRPWLECFSEINAVGAHI